MGLGIWSMHYIGMLAFSLSVPVSYDWPTVLLASGGSFASAVALFVVSRQKMGWARALAGSAIMGAASRSCTIRALRQCACLRMYSYDRARTP
jgi:NO-binding membrane sensor protein with MHYT domain